MIEIEGVYKTPMKSWPFYKCKHFWLIFHVDQFGRVYICPKCRKTKEKEAFEFRS